MDKNLKNIGWDLMKARLDKEMPEKKKKRSFFYWYLLSGALFISSLTYLKYFNSSNQKFDNGIQEQISNISSHTASLNSSAYSQDIDNSNTSLNTPKNNAEDEVTLIQEKAIISNVLSSNGQEIKVNKKDNSLPHPSVIDSKIKSESSYEKSLNISLVEPKKEEVNIANNEVALSIQQDNITNVAQSYTETFRTTENPNPEIKIEKVNNIEKREEIKIEKIAIRTLNELSYVNIVNPTLNLVRPQTSNEKLLFGLYVSAGVNSVPFEFKNHIPMIGIRSSIDLNKNFKISTGLLYGRSVKDSIQFLYDYRASNVDKNFSGTFPEANQSNYINLKNIQIYKFNTLAIPVMGEYRLYKNLWLRGGISYNINKVEKLDYELQNKGSWSSIDQNIDNLVSNLASNNLIRNHFTWQGGLGINVTKRLSLSVDLLGRSDFTNSINKSKNPQIQLFASYKVL